MAQVPASPARGRSYDSDRRAILAEQERLSRQKAPTNPGSVQSTDGSTIRIPGPLADTDRQGKVLTWDEDLHQPLWQTPSSGGIVGMAQVVSSGGVVFPSGSNVLSYSGVTYSAPYDPNAGGPGESDVSVSSWLTVDGYQLLLSPGWYIPVLSMTVIWDNPADAPPAFGGPYMYGGWDSAHNSYAIHAQTPYSGGKAGFVQIGNYGPTFVPSTSDLHAELRAVGGDPTAGNNLTYSAIVWNITKLG